MDPITLLVISNPAADHLKLLERLPEPVNIVAGNDPEFIDRHAPHADAILSNWTEKDLLRRAFLGGKRLRWVHTLAAGVDKLLFPELIESPIPFTNGRGVFKEALSEFAIGAVLFFAKDFRQLVRNQEARRWQQFDVEFVRGKVLGVVGFGEIGRETARLARALGMQVIATRRRSALSNGDAPLDRAYAPDQLREMLAASDYVVVSTPLTPETHSLIGAAELGAMRPWGVIINVGRGPVIVESALIEVLKERRIKGAALDVFAHEPLPENHPFYGLDNVLLSPHSADHTVGWIELSMQKFLENFERFRSGQPLDNVVDKKAGY